MRTAVLAFAALALLACDETTAEEYQSMVEAARACNDGDTCVLAGDSECICPTPVNASSKDDIDATASEFECENVETRERCVSHSNVRCEGGRCISGGGGAGGN